MPTIQIKLDQKTHTALRVLVAILDTKIQPYITSLIKHELLKKETKQ